MKLEVEFITNILFEILVHGEPVELMLTFHGHIKLRTEGNMANGLFI